MDGVGCEAVRCGAVSWEGGSLGWKRVSVDSWGKGERGEGRGDWRRWAADGLGRQGETSKVSIMSGKGCETRRRKMGEGRPAVGEGGWVWVRTWRVLCGLGRGPGRWAL